MQPQPKDQVLEVWGELACFTRPEMKAERFSYSVITPSAARGIYDAIYCKRTEFRWQITRIEILKEPRYIALRRNEVENICTYKGGRGGVKPIVIDENNRQQRQTMALKSVRYRLHAEIHPWRGFEDRLQAMEAQFRRRAASGKCIYQPYFGCREFPAYFELVEPGTISVPPIDLDLGDLGWVLYDVYDLARPFDPVTWEQNDHNVCISLFEPKVAGNVIIVPPYESPEVKKGTRRER